MDTEVGKLFESGMAEALEDVSREPLKAGRVVETSDLSAWLYLICPVCKHTFRSGDRVELGPKGPQHNQNPIACPSQSLENEASGERDEFFAGLQEGWPPPADQQVYRLTSRSPHLAPPLGGLGRRACQVCDHTFRAGDEVLICPCSPQKPMCEAAIHRDPMHHLHCWETWNPGETRTHCPITLRKLK